MSRILLNICLLLLVAACHSPESKRQTFNYMEIKQAAEKGKRNFNPGFVTDFYAARVFKINNYEIQDSLLRVERLTVPVMRTVAGEIPDDNSPGPFRVAFFSEKGEKLYEYGMASPLYVRHEHGAHKGLYKVKDGSFLVPVPAIKNAVRMEMKDSDGTTFETTFRIQ